MTIRRSLTVLTSTVQLSQRTPRGVSPSGPLIVLYGRIECSDLLPHLLHFGLQELSDIAGTSHDTGSLRAHR